MAVPQRVLTNADLEKMVDTSDQWILERTGIRERRVAGEDETSSTLGAAAGREALESAGLDPLDVDLIVCATTSPDMLFPSTACLVQHQLGCVRAAAFDLSAACSGFAYGLAVTSQLVATGAFRNALLVGVDVLTKFLDWTDRSTCVLFGDGAGAVVLRAGEGGPGGTGPGLISTHLHADGSYADLLYVDGGPGVSGTSGRVRMNGREVFRHAVAKLSAVVDEALAANGLDHAAVDWLVPHQANLRIIEAVAKKLQLPMERVVVTVDRHANTSGASIPLALAEAKADGRLRPGQLVLMEAIGGGLTWGAALLRL